MISLYTTYSNLQIILYYYLKQNYILYSILEILGIQYFLLYNTKRYVYIFLLTIPHISFSLFPHTLSRKLVEIFILSMRNMRPEKPSVDGSIFVLIAI